ncbi:MAG: citrate synthase [Culicoidibacterales bacterium]
MKKTFLADISDMIYQNNAIEPALYEKFDVKRGLRHQNGTGVLVGLTKIGAVHGYQIIDGEKIPQQGRLYYRDYELKELDRLFKKTSKYSFEKTIFLLLFGQLPTDEQLLTFREELFKRQDLPEEFTENFLLRKPSKNIMNQLQRAVVCMYTIDDNPDDISLPNLIAQTVNMIAKFPSILTYSYNAHRHKHCQESLVIHSPQPDFSIAENILHMLRHDNEYSQVEVETLDLLLVIHAEHGGGNNSTFTSHVVSSTGTDTYSAIAASIGSLKGPKHGGANTMVAQMIANIKENVENPTLEALEVYLGEMLRGQKFDGSGLIYGLGHAIYTISDPRADLLRQKAEQLAESKGELALYNLYKNVEIAAIRALKNVRGVDFAICANVDFYSSFVYQLLCIPQDLYTPLFATARIASWNAHRIEQLVFDKKIIRPAYKAIDALGNLL